MLAKKIYDVSTSHDVIVKRMFSICIIMETQLQIYLKMTSDHLERSYISYANVYVENIPSTLTYSICYQLKSM